MPEETNVIGVAYKYDPVYHRFADYMGVDAFSRKDFETAKKLALLYDYAVQKSGSDDFTKVAGVVEGLRRRSGVTFSGESLVSYLHQHVRLEMDKMPKKPEKTPTKQDRYEVDKGKGKDMKDDHKQAVKDVKKEGQLAKRRNVDYIKRHRESQPKAKPDKIPTVDAIGYVPKK